MVQTKEINALFTLIDDPDEEVFMSVSERIINFGKVIIPNLEHLWENTPNESIQERIELLIHKLHFTDLKTEFENWLETDDNDLLQGTLLVAKFQYPDMNTESIIQNIEKIKRNVWLELNNFLTPLEQANVLSSIIFNYFKLKGTEINYHNADEFFIHKVLETKKGNALINAIIYQVIAENLAINAKLINIPQQAILAFFFKDISPLDLEDNAIFRDHILFYVDGISGQAYGQTDIDSYFKRLSIKPVNKFFKPFSNKEIILLLLKELAKCFDNYELQYKQNELMQLINLITE